jgi:hypothetical protein
MNSFQKKKKKNKPFWPVGLPAFKWSARWTAWFGQTLKE